MVATRLPNFAEAGDNVTICRGDSTNLMASGGDFYKWEPIDNLDRNDVADPWVKPRITTTYIVHVTNADGETDSDSVTVFVRQRPLLVTGPDLSVCLGEPAQLSASGSGEFRWFPTRTLNNSDIPDSGTPHLPLSLPRCSRRWSARAAVRVDRHADNRSTGVIPDDLGAQGPVSPPTASGRSRHGAGAVPAATACFFFLSFAVPGPFLPGGGCPCRKFTR